MYDYVSVFNKIAASINDLLIKQNDKNLNLNAKQY